MRLTRCLALVLCSSLVVGCGLKTDQHENDPREAAREGSLAEARATADSSPSAALTLAEPVHDVVLLTIDTLRADAVGFAGNAAASTPNLDALAAQGWVYDNAHSHNVMTLPSHVNLLTGRLPFEHGVRDNSGYRLASDVPTAAGFFDGAGFTTGAFVSAFPLDARYGLDRDFGLYDDRFDESQSQGFALAERPATRTVASAMRWWTENEGKYRFLWLHLYDPHAPYEPSEPFRTRFADRPYLGEVASVDAAIAPLIELWRKQSAPIFLVVTSDHGEALGEHGEQTHGLFAYEATLAVPLLIWSNALDSAGRRSHRPVRQIDLLPTMLDAAGLEVPASLKGHPLTRALDRDLPSYFEVLGPALNRGWAPLFGTIWEGRKFIELPLPELYDLAADPRETDNLLAADRASYRAWREKLPEQAVWPPGGSRSTSLAGDEEAALRRLGYLPSDAATKLDFGPDDDPKNLIQVDRSIQDFVGAFQSGNLEEALTNAARTIELRPQMGLGYLNMAQAQLELAKRDPQQLLAAIATMSRAVERGAATPSLRRQLALSLAETGQLDQALVVLEPLEDSKDPETLNARGLVLTEAGRLAEAKAAFDAVFRLDPRNTEAHANLARLAIFANRWSDAEASARRALELNPGLALTWNHLALSLYNQRRLDEAFAAWQRSIELDPNDYDVLFNLGIVAFGEGRLDIARPALERFLAEAPTALYRQDKERVKQRLAQISG